MESNVQFVFRSPERSQTIPQKEESNGRRVRVTIGIKEAGSGALSTTRAAWGKSEDNPVDPLMRGWEGGTEEEVSEESAIE